MSTSRTPALAPARGASSLSLLSPLRTRLAAGALLLCALPAGCGDSGPSSGATGTIEVGITGEDAAVSGLPFTDKPAADQIVLVDGWSLKFERWLVSVENIRLNQPGKDPAQQQIVGDAVASQAGPWLVNVVRDERPALTAFSAQANGQPFDTTVRYAFSFDLSPAKASAKRVNLDASDDAAVAEMTQRGWSNYVEVTATHAPYAATDDMAFKDYPTRVNFKLGWGGAVSYLNCSNPDNGTDEEQNRGVQPSQSGVKRADIFLHVEHPFWDTLTVENPGTRFDAIAARATTRTEGGQVVGDVTMDDLAGALVTKLTTKAGADVKDRTVPGLIAGYTRKTGALAYDPKGTAGITDLKQFITYSSQAFAHLNGEGLCYVKRN